MMETLYFSVVLSVTLIPPHASATLTKRPENKATIISTNVIFQCATDSGLPSINWKKDGQAITIGDVIIDDNPKYALDKASEGDYYLSVTSLGNSDTGKYTCEDVIGAGDELSAELLFVDDGLAANSTVSPDGIVVEGHMIYYECSVGYAGRWAPSVEIYNQNGEKLENQTDVSGGVVTTWFSDTVNRTMSGASYNCRARFVELDPAPGGLEAGNVPTFSRYYQFDQTLRVHYGPEEVQLTPDEYRIKVGTGMLCGYESNPGHSNIVFTDTYNGESREVQRGPQSGFVIPVAWYGQNHTLQCTVFVTVGSGSDEEEKAESSQQVSFEATADGSRNLGSPLAAVVSSVVVVITVRVYTGKCIWQESPMLILCW